MNKIQDALAVIWSLILSIRVADVVDMALIAFLVYRVMRFAQRTNMGRLVRGVIMVIIALWLSNVLELGMISFLLGKTVEIGLLAIIVLFQPEMRHLLEQVGAGGKFNRLFSKQIYDKDMENAVVQTVLACESMAKERTGALIIFERNIRLDEPIKTGTMVNADVSSELLKALFYHNAPLHDGAVIIRGGRVAAAACMLPLSNNQNLSRDLGMRHRAGIGMSENSDAVVVIVSEETGGISVAVGGMLKRHLTVDTFELLLRSELLPSAEKKKKKGFWARKGRVKKGD